MSQTTAQSESRGRALRFVHASDLLLDQPPHGMVDDPDHLRPQLIDCPYDAAQNIFDAAIVETADALLLSGNVVDFDLAGPRAVVFLQTQFARLDEKNIPVFWAGGESDPPGAWPAAAPLPKNVHIFPATRVESHPLTRGGKTIARIVGVSHARGEEVPLDRFRRDADGYWTLGVAHGRPAREDLERSQVDFLALGGRTSPQTTHFGGQVAHYPGSPQGRSPQQTDATSCTLVEVDHEGKIALKPIDVDSLRFVIEQIDVDAETTLTSLEARMHERVQSIVAKTGERDVIITWRLTGEGRHMNELRRGGAEGVISRLREKYGHKSPAVWSVEIVLVPDAKLPEEWFEQETILGDVVRRIREIEKTPTTPLELGRFLSGDDRKGRLAAIANFSSAAHRGETLREAATIAADLLAGSSNSIDA